MSESGYKENISPSKFINYFENSILLTPRSACFEDIRKIIF